MTDNEKPLHGEESTAPAQELSDDDLDQVAGGFNTLSNASKNVAQVGLGVAGVVIPGGNVQGNDH